MPYGTVVARDEALGITLWRLTGPLARTTTVTGLYPNDTWSGPTVTWTRLRCRPGVLRADLHTDPGLFDDAAARAGDDAVRDRRRRGGGALPADADCDAPHPRPAGGRRALRRALRVTPTAVPSEVDPTSRDDRVLGVHFDVLSYTPRP